SEMCIRDRTVTGPAARPSRSAGRPRAADAPHVFAAGVAGRALSAPSAGLMWLRTARFAAQGLTVGGT
ncbi:hypothetical protein, partial [Streptomyces sp. b94]|uniref:hypothetical protein n=1 Tax=Streptomyces sp. b94 TaxID=1827634 RepID=UPI0015CEF645